MALIELLTDELLRRTGEGRIGAAGLGQFVLPGGRCIEKATAAVSLEPVPHEGGLRPVELPGLSQPGPLIESQVQNQSLVGAVDDLAGQLALVGEVVVGGSLLELSCNQVSHLGARRNQKDGAKGEHQIEGAENGELVVCGRGGRAVR